MDFLDKYHPIHQNYLRKYTVIYQNDHKSTQNEIQGECFLLSTHHLHHRHWE